jgi:uncharacterized membrane protein YfcA
MLCATLVFALSPAITKWLTARGQGARSLPMQLLGRFVEFLFCIYGGFFGAGLGVFLMAGYAVAGIENLKQTNVLKNMMGMVVTTTSALTFIVRGEVDWPAAIAVLSGALVGGFAGGKLARVIPDMAMRVLVTAGGLFMAGWYFIR